jgi:hypothetical protein
MANVLRKADVCGSLGTDAEPHGSGSDKDQSPLGERDSGLDEAMDGMKKHLKLRSLRQILLGLDGDGRCPDEADASSNATDKALLSLDGRKNSRSLWIPPAAHHGMSRLAPR